MSPLGDVIAGAAGQVADEVFGGIDALVRHAAVELLNGMLPPLVRAQNAVIKSTAWVGVAGHSGAVAMGIASAGMNNGVIQGMVAKKVNQGLHHLTTDNDYHRAVNSIR